MEIPLRPLGVSEILDGAVTYIRRNPRATLGMSAILTSVIQVIVTVAQYFIIGGEARIEAAPNGLARSLGWAFITFVAGSFLAAYVVLLLSGLLSPVMARTLLGRTTSFGGLWRIVRPRLPRLLGAATLVIGLVFFAVAIPFAPLIGAVVGGATTGVQAACWILGVSVSIVLMVTGYVWFALAPPILVLERRGVIASLRRSAEIVKGRWWRTFGVLFLSLVITLLAEFLVLPTPFTVAQRAVLGVNPNPSGWALVGLVAIGAVGRVIAGTLVNPFNACVIAMVYADRRMRREAFDLELQMDPPDDPVAGWLPGPLTAAGSGPQPKVPRGPLMMPPGAPPMGVPPTYAPPYPPPPGWSR
jgi:MFS family permease